VFYGRRVLWAEELVLSEIPETRESLLVRLKDPHDREAWDQFSVLYRPVIYRIARGRGLQDADAQDLAQHVLMAVASAIPRWRRNEQNVRFRHWLRRVVKNATINALSRRPKDLAGGGSALMDLLQQSPQRDAATEEAILWEHRREVYRRASGVVRGEIQESTWEVFRRTVVDGESIESVANSMGKSVGAIYVARCRIMNRLRDIVRDFEEAWDQ
jgi:RNA polymerase sigma-70 factor (ECF subfamily)